MSKIKVVGICAEGPRHGKDTFYKLLRQYGTHPVPYMFRRYAFADELKEACAPLIGKLFNWDTDKLTPEQKEIVRPIWIAVGEAARKTDPMHWMKIVDQYINWTNNDNEIAVITDVRYYNEAKFFKDKYGDQFLLVQVHNETAGTPPPSELISFPALQKLVDVKIVWPDVKGDTPKLIRFVEDFTQIYFPHV